MPKITVAVLYGGRSAEHEVSLNSAKNIIGSFDKEKYNVLPVKISKKGEFSLDFVSKADVVFPVLHGPYGEDGSMQGFLKILGLPFVGASVLGSALGMDKEIAKRVLRDKGLPVGKFEIIKKGQDVNFKEIKKSLGLPMFVKPANMGSSVGISKVKNEKEFISAIKESFLYDKKIIIEEETKGREIECAVLGNENPTASILGEIIPLKDFYSYEAKYTDQNGARLEIPAKLSESKAKEIQDLAIKVFETLDCSGLARVDFFLQKNGKVLVNEINTLPGFTDISMYPKLWEYGGLPIAELLDILITLAIDNFNKINDLKVSV
ncbi:MAG: D-alanine--D-alanine ligase [Candidatus Pacebacteria bacterium]|nr:D-alanine--D-alanine ligase [Candidatus Paceibacterota bacterium]MCF7862870.1 D-alanine--D-alanine ligase [Candidatus Paceibacterota bacterium]